MGGITPMFQPFNWRRQSIFLANPFEIESLDKLRMVQEDGLFLRFLRDVVEPNTDAEESFSFETDPSKDLRYS